MWIEFEQGDPDYPIWVGCFWGSAAEVPALALAGPPGLQQIVVQTIGQNTLLISDVPGPTGGILLQVVDGRAHLRLRHRHHDQQRPGRDDHHDRPAGHHQRRRAGGDLTMPGFLIQQGATVMCAHGGQAHGDGAEPGRHARRHAHRHRSPPRGPSPAAPACPPPVPPCVTAQWITGTTRVTSYGQPLVIQGGEATCAPAGTPLLPVVTQIRVTAT